LPGGRASEYAFPALGWKPSQRLGTRRTRRNVGDRHCLSRMVFRVSLAPGVPLGVIVSRLCLEWHLIRIDFAWRQSLRICIPSPWLEAQPEAGNEKKQPLAGSPARG